MQESTPTRRSLLVGDNARRDDVDQAWEQDNQAWWDWYVSLAQPEAPHGRQAPVDDTDDMPLAAASAPPALDGDVHAFLQTPYALSEAQIGEFQRRGFLKLKNVLSAAVAARLREEMVRLLEAAYASSLDGGTRARFLSLELVWLENALIRAFVTSPRIAGIAGELLDVSGVRLYHDNLMSKEPGCGRTPWHYDDHHFPLATQEVVTAWIPAQAIPRRMGPLAFAHPIDVWKRVRDVPFNKFDTSYDQQVGEIFRDGEVAIDDSSFALGEVSFHHNLSFHTAGPNLTELSRVVLANTYFADGARVLDRPTMVSGDWQKFMPGVAPGGLANSALNPVCWSRVRAQP
ncbi:MAG: phytanoyl-CoA dioxygenase family protein [Pseudomonadota bacterium]